ncbi:MAG TPA: glycosyltransferase [Candidatus Angelobacter sp.]
MLTRQISTQPDVSRRAQDSTSSPSSVAKEPREPGENGMSARGKKERIFISWAPFCSRSDSIIKHLGGTSYMVYSPFWGSNPFTILFKYLTQSMMTLWILLRDRPRVIFVMTPPVIVCFPVWLYTRLTKSCYLIDAHSGALVDRRWQSTMFLHRFFSRHARATMVTNPHLRDFVQSWGADAMIVRDVPVCFAEPSPMTLSGAFNITLVNTFTRDEPLELFLRAAEKLPDVQFYVTGPLAGADERVINTAPKNVKFTGFLPNSQYVGLLLASDAVMCLTTREHTMQRGAYEAVYLEKPVVVSSTELLRNAFYKGAVCVQNTVEGIVGGVQEMRKHLRERQEEVRSLRQEKLEQWSRVEADLLNI